MQHFRICIYFTFNIFISRKELEIVGRVKYPLKCDLEYFNHLKSRVLLLSACELTTEKGWHLMQFHLLGISAKLQLYAELFAYQNMGFFKNKDRFLKVLDCYVYSTCGQFCI